MVAVGANGKTSTT